MHVLNIIFYSLAASYLDLVFPNEWGKKKHPLFFIPYFNRRHEDSAKLNVAHSGKTSTLYMLTGLSDISSGNATWFVFDVQIQVDYIR